MIKEGAYPDCWDCLNTYGESGSQCCYGTEEQCSQCDEVMMEWEKLWTSTIKKSDIDRYGWNANPTCGLSNLSGVRSRKRKLIK